MSEYAFNSHENQSHAIIYIFAIISIYFIYTEVFTVTLILAIVIFLN